MIDELEQPLKNAVEDVARTMLQYDLQPIPVVPGALEGGLHIASSVGFIGTVTGVVYLYASAEFAKSITAQLLGMAESEIDGDEMVNDSMGELANMVGGNLKGFLSDHGHICSLTIPSIIRGSHFSIQAISTALRRVLSYRVGEKNHLMVELIIKAPEGK